MKNFYSIVLFSALLFLACREKSHTTDKVEEIEEIKIKEKEDKSSIIDEKVTVQEDNKETKAISKDTITVRKSTPSIDKKSEKVSSEFSMIDPQSGIVIDIKYATKDNFTKKQIYPCGKCYLRPAAANAIINADKILKQKYGYRLKMFDCYRPRPAQQRLWDVVPNADYVTPPAKGSMHNRGLAVDLTIVDNNGKELDMGTPYDFFGKEAHTDNKQLPSHVLNNRLILSSAMKEVGFVGIRTEWWHFSLDQKAALSDWEWPCK